ncbi:MAG: heme oxygenase [Geoglossum simile]|nr:MAG: heme oxygenase [Geoglossum simile]
MSEQTRTPIERRMPLSTEINETTGEAHATLNRLIASRLPLALPPHSTTPTLYGQGLLHFAPIYLTFESLWLSLLHTTPVATPSLEFQDHTGFPLRDLDPIHHAHTSSSTPDGDPHRCRASISPQVHTYLEQLLIPGLMRGECLREDLSYLTGLSVAELKKRLDHPEGKQVSEFVAHIRSTVLSKPHVLVAYTWVMYMAVFSGGRWIRAQMRLAGENFWSQPAAQAGVSMSGRKARGTIGMEFFHFKGPEDGKDIKSEYKRRFAELDKHLTTGERQDIVSEALKIFLFNRLMVEELDNALKQNTSPGVFPPSNPTSSSVGPSTKRPTGDPLRTASWVKDFKSQAAKFMEGGASSPPSFPNPGVVVTQQKGYVDQGQEEPTRASIVIRASLIAILSVFLWLLLLS